MADYFKRHKYSLTSLTCLLLGQKNMIFIEHLLSHFVFYYGKKFNISDFISKCTFFSVNKINKSDD